MNRNQPKGEMLVEQEGEKEEEGEEEAKESNYKIWHYNRTHDCKSGSLNFQEWLKTADGEERKRWELVDIHFLLTLSEYL